jgi:hypothetical protein
MGVKHLPKHIKLPAIKKRKKSTERKFKFLELMKKGYEIK